MGLLHFVVSTAGKCLDAVCLLLDINFLIVHTIVRGVVAAVSFVHSLPSLALHSALQLGDLLLLGAASGAEAAWELLHGAAAVLGTLPPAAEGLLESLKMVGYLCMHVLLRGKEQLCRGALSVAEGCGVTAGVLLSSAQSVVDFVLLVALNVYAAALGVWQMVSSPLQKVLELALTLACSLLAFLWAPCKLLLNFSLALIHVLVSVFILNIYGLLLTVAIALTTAAYLNPELSRQAAAQLAEHLRSLPGVGRAGVALQRARRSMRLLRRTLRRLYLLERGLWQQLPRHISQLSLLLRTHLHRRDGRARGDGDPGEGRRDPPDGRAGDGARREPMDTLLPSSSTARPLKRQPSPGSEDKHLPAENLLTLLKEQEERKKCVICQDCAKTVVLLPCRHLCLCRDCTAILLRQPLYLQNCPLCRHMILNTMDVYL